MSGFVYSYEHAVDGHLLLDMKGHCDMRARPRALIVPNRTCDRQIGRLNSVFGVHRTPGSFDLPTAIGVNGYHSRLFENPGAF